MTSRKEVKATGDESQTSEASKKWRMDAFPDPPANYMQLQVRRVEVVVVCISFVYVLWDHCDFDLMIFLEREVKMKLRARRRSSGGGRLPTKRTVLLSLSLPSPSLEKRKKSNGSRKRELVVSLSGRDREKLQPTNAFGKKTF